MEEEKEDQEMAVRSLRDKLEEVEWAKKQLEEKLRSCEEKLEEVIKEVEKEVTEMKTGIKEVEETVMKEVEKEVRERKTEVKEIMEVEIEEGKKKIMEVEERLNRKIDSTATTATVGTAAAGNTAAAAAATTTTTTTTTATENREGQVGRRRRRCLVITDSNGQRATPDSIRNHIVQHGQDDDEEIDIEIEVVYRMEDLYKRIVYGRLDVSDREVILDNLTNNVRGGKKDDPDSPDSFLTKVDILRHIILGRGAKALLVMQIKPMRHVDVRPYNECLNRYLKDCPEPTFGCKTQIRMSQLKADNFHIHPMYDGVLDRTYACAILRVNVPSPTPYDDFVPIRERRNPQQSWPRLVRGGNEGP